MQEMQVPSLGLEDPLEEEIATHSSILAWRIPWTEESDWLQSIGLQGIGHDLAAKQQQTTTKLKAMRDCGYFTELRLR